MQNITRMVITLTVLAISMGCRGSNDVVSPANQMSLGATASAGDAIQKAPQQAVTVQLQSLGGKMAFELQATLNSSGSCEYSGSGEFEFDGVYHPVVVVMQFERMASGKLSIELQLESPNGGMRVQLTFDGVGSYDPGSQTGTFQGQMQGTVFSPLSGGIRNVNVPAQSITLGSVVGRGC